MTEPFMLITPGVSQTSAVTISERPAAQPGVTSPLPVMLVVTRGGLPP
jgi:hypothetical protein